MSDITAGLWKLRKQRLEIIKRCNNFKKNGFLPTRNFCPFFEIFLSEEIDTKLFFMVVESRSTGSNPDFFIASQGFKWRPQFKFRERISLINETKLIKL